MDETTQTTLDKYVELFETLKKRVGEDPAVVILPEMARDARSAQIRAERAAAKLSAREPADSARQAHGSVPATMRQLDWLHDLNVSVPRDLTKAQASALLDEALAKQAA